ncbi:cupin domain-containing protein [Variovorax paradoxus]|nr:cupin domain-containing protein [Variovorax paradoxus]MBT2305201.1 cupin domain-containing protein [Variovorax paradoxus]
MALSNNIRRVVTTVDANDRAVVLFDGNNPHNYTRETGNISRLFWKTDQTPADITGAMDRAAGYKSVCPPDGGTLLRIVDFPPITKENEALSAGYQQKIIAEPAPMRGLPPRHAFMHRTRTIDYAIVLHGEIDMLLDEDEIHLTAGDVLVQQGTNHAWVNRGTETCRVAFILIDSKEP